MADPALIPPEQHDYEGGWLVISAEGKASHVMPAGDLRDHECCSECWCRPFIDDEDDLIVHNALDRREDVECGRSKLQ